MVRGGNPTRRDRTVASMLGVKAVESLVEGKYNVVMIERDGEIVDMDIAFALMTDRMYKGKLKDGDLDKFTPEQVEEMKAICKMRQDEMEKLHKFAQDVSF